MHDIEPYYNWDKYYSAQSDEQSPFYGRTYSELYFENDIYGYFIHPQWDYFGSQTLYLKILYANYHHHYAIIELFGEWNDAIHNDIMHFKRNVIEPLIQQGITKFILIGENIFQFHGCVDDDYYHEWYEEVDDEDGWIVAINFREFILEQWQQYCVDHYFNFGGMLNDVNWRTQTPEKLFLSIDKTIQYRLGV